MTDKIIINTISKIHFIIVSFLIFIFLTLSVVFVILQNGLYIDSISVQNLKIEKLYIKWEKKININVEKVDFTSQANKKVPFDYKNIKQTFKKLVLFNSWFEKIVIDRIRVNEIFASFKYSDKDNGFFVASSPDFLLKSLLFLKSDIINLHIKEFHDLKRKIDVDGDLIFDLKKLTLVASLNMDINHDANIKFISYADENRLFYRIQTLENIKHTRHIISLLKLPREVKYWVLDAVSMSSLSFEHFYGWFEYAKIGEAYKHIYVNATINNLLYKYNPRLNGVQTKTTELEFKDGILNILPKEAYTYNFFLDKSWLRINFNQKDELLTLFLKFKGSVDKNILNILHSYKIKLPFIQNKGVVNTNLKVDVNLVTMATNAVGDFFTREANVNYLGLDIDIYDTYVSLNNFDIKIENMLAKYKDIAKAKVNVELNVKKHEGKIEFKIQSAEFKKMGLSLKKQAKSLAVTYKVSPTQDIIKIEDSQWNFKNKELAIKSLNVAFDLKELSAEIPATLVEVPGILNAFVSGKVLLKSSAVSLKIDLLKFLYDDIRLSQSNAQIELNYEDGNIRLKLPEKTRFNTNNIETMIENLSLKLKDNNFYINHGSLNIGNIITTNFNGYYNLQSKNGALNLNNLNLKYKNTNDIFSDDETVKLVVTTNDKNITLSSSKLSVEYILAGNEWKFKVNSLSKIAKKSQLLRDYNLTQGSFILHKQADKSNNINLSANIKYPYKLVVKNNIELEDYAIKGKINSKTKKIYLNINDEININIDDDVRVKTKNIGINIDEILNLINNRNSTSNKSSNKIIFNSKNCYLYIDKNRRIISDTINLQSLNNSVTAQLSYHGAQAGFKLENSEFHLYGDNFDDKFMENLFALSKFKDGTLAFSINGSTTEYGGIFIVKDTTVLDYKILNNILAFVNTIPSLVTFNLPGYSSKGLPVKEAYMNFNAKDGVYNITDISLNSPELDILGRGTANIKMNTINLDLNLKTDLGSDMSKIPAVGYILFGDNSISTSINVTGSLSNPDVHSKLAQEIIVAPLNIIKRTLLFPYKLLKGNKK